MEPSGEKKTKHFIEAALFMSSEPVSIESLSRLVNSSVEETRVALNDLAAELEERKSALEIRIESFGVRLAVRKEFDGFIKNFSAVPELNKSILKTLALVSYKQPIRQSEVIRIRNNKAYDHIKILEEKGFIKREEVGRTYMIYTTKKFVDYFGLSALQKQHEKKII